MTAEEEDRDLQPVDEECKTKEATQKSGHMKFEPKDDDGTHLEHCSTAKTRHQKACHSRPAHASLFPNLTRRCQIKVNRLGDGEY